jgi:hypothetical protein
MAAALGDDWFREVRAAAAAAGQDTRDRLAFEQLAPVQRVVDDLLPPSQEAPGALAEGYGILLFSVYHFWLGGRREIALDRERLERIIARGASPAPLHVDAGWYVQLPERAVWARITEGSPPEPLDGLFVTPGASGREITVLAVLGLRPEREGFSQIAVTVPTDDWYRAGMVVRRPLFAPVLEGGERAGLKSLVSEAELLHLAHLALAEATQ